MAHDAAATGIAPATSTPTSAIHLLRRVRAFALPDLPDSLGSVARALISGLITSVVVIAYAIGYSALLFHDDLAAGAPIALWSMMMGALIAGVWIGIRTTVPPLGIGMDAPSVPVLVLLSAGIGSDVVASGGTTSDAIRHMLLAITFATAISGLLLWAIGHFRLGRILRFIPYCVIGGFLAATGWLLIEGGAKLVTGRPLAVSSFLTPLASDKSIQSLVALGFVIALLLARRWIKGSALLPAAFVLTCVVILYALHALGVSAEDGWLVPGMGSLQAWQPFVAATTSGTKWWLLATALPQAIVLTGVILFSSVVKISALEVMRSTNADLDQELRANGIGNVAASVVGGMSSSFLTSASRLLVETGSRSRWAGITCGVIIGVVLLFGVDLTHWTPVAALAGMIVYLGYVLLTDALRRPFAQGARLDLALALMIMAVCIRYGYIPGLFVGIIVSCIIFAYNYGRLGVLRRHLTRATFASNTDRPSEIASYLVREGDAIHIYWVSGYIFFGSSDGMFEEVRTTIEGQRKPVRFIIFDSSGVVGADAAAIMSLLKLRSFAEKRGIKLVFSGLSVAIRQVLDMDRYFDPPSPHRAFDTRSDALEWCEEQLIAAGQVQGEETLQEFENWLAGLLGARSSNADVLRYFKRQHFVEAREIYRQGDPAESIDLVAHGTVSITYNDGEGHDLRVRRMTTRTVVGEMGFFRNSPRTASVHAHGDVVLYTLTRECFDQMGAEQPELARALLAFIVRTLADRVEFANKEVASLA